MNNHFVPFSKRQKENPTEHQDDKEKIPWKLGRHVKPDHIEMLDKLVEEYKQQMINDMRKKRTIFKKKPLDPVWFEVTPNS